MNQSKTMNNQKSCHYCQRQEVRKGGLINDWITENHYLGKHGQILKECPNRRY